MVRIKRILSAFWQFCSYVFWPQRRTVDNDEYREKDVNNTGMIRILQFSDIHWTISSPWEEQFTGLRSAFKNEIENLRKANKKVDYLFICGDIAFKGINDEYTQAMEYIDKLCRLLELKRKDVFVVPGNHDLNRKSDGHELRELINIALATDDRNEDFLKTVHKDKSLNKTLYAAFQDYNMFAKEYLCHDEVMNKCLSRAEDVVIADTDKMFYDHNLKDIGDITVTLTGVNTALNCDGWDYNDAKGKGHKQMLAKRAYYKSELKKQELRILMGHHPLEFLASKDRIREDLDNIYQLQFFGHVHDQMLQGDEKTVRILSGAFDPPKDKFNPDKYKPVYNLVEITQDTEKSVRVECTARIWNKTSFDFFKKGSFVRKINIERDLNPWSKDMGQEESIDVRAIKFKYMELENRTDYFNMIDGVVFFPNKDKTENDNCLDFLMKLESTGKLQELAKIMR